jgi:hypothetical protein
MTELGRIANALHAIQDAWPVGHWGYQPWGGLRYWPPGTDPIVHLIGDTNPSPDTVQFAVDRSWQYLRDVARNYFTSRAWYLPNSCR